MCYPRFSSICAMLLPTASTATRTKIQPRGQQPSKSPLQHQRPGKDRSARRSAENNPWRPGDQQDCDSRFSRAHSGTCRVIYSESKVLLGPTSRRCRLWILLCQPEPLTCMHDRHNRTCAVLLLLLVLPRSEFVVLPQGLRLRLSGFISGRGHIQHAR